MTTFAIAQPWLLAGVVMPVLALVAVLFAARRRRTVARILGGASAMRAGFGVRAVTSGLVVLAILLAVLAGARPQWGEGDQVRAQQGIDLIIALDVSRSMEAEDVTSSRAQAAAAGLSEMLVHMTGNRVGLVVFAGDAFARAPLTVDLPVLTSMVTRAQPEAPLVAPGTNYRDALAEAFRLLDVDDAASTQAVLLVSDGEDLSDDYQTAVDFASRRDIRVYTVFAGTSNPTPLPETSGGTDVTVARPDVLQEIADQTGATFRTGDRIPGLAVEFRRLQQTQFGEATQHEPIERFAWFAGAAAILLLVVAMLGDGAAPRLPQVRRGVITAALSTLAAVFLVGCGNAAWQHVRAGTEAYEAERFEEALAEYRQAAESLPEDSAINYNIANTLHRLGRLEEAVAAAEQARTFAEAGDDAVTSGLALYTLGNTHFRQGDLEAARDAYIGTLRIDPADNDAKANLELVLALLAPPPPADEPQDPGAGEDGEGDEGDGGDGAGAGEPSESEEGDPGAGEPGSSGDPADGDTETPSPGSGPGSPEGGVSGSAPTTLEEAQAALERALGELGPEVTLEEALRILELSRRANELNPLPRSPGSSVPPR
ncbi:MAG: VWA domain-containing protein [Chloroflexi bacterium]|nr:VWA domain-containing protein [Chloroflexota bacterium]